MWKVVEPCRPSALVDWPNLAMIFDREPLQIDK